MPLTFCCCCSNIPFSITTISLFTIQFVACSIFSYAYYMLYVAPTYIDCHYETATAAAKILDFLLAGDSDALTVTHPYIYLNDLSYMPHLTKHKCVACSMRYMYEYLNVAQSCLCGFAALLLHCRF